MLNFAKAIGANTDFLTSQAFIFEGGIKTSNDDSNNPNGLLVIALSGWAQDGFTRVHKAGLDGRDLFFDLEGAVGDRFEKLTQFLETELKDFEKIEGILGFFEDNSLYLQTINDFNCFLLRQGSTITLTQKVESGKLISGLLEDKDRILFLSPPLSESPADLPQNLIDNLLKSTPENLEDEMEAFLQAQPKPDPISSVLVVVENSEETEGIVENPNLPQALVNDSSPGSRLAIFNKLPIEPPDLKRLFLRLGAKKILIFGLILIIGLLMIINLWQKQINQDKIFKNALAQANQNLDRAMALKDSDQNQAKIALDTGKKYLTQAASIKPQDKQVLDLQNRFQDQSYQILKQYQVTNFAIFLDLNLIKQGFTTTKLSEISTLPILIDLTSKPDKTIPASRVSIIM